MKTFKILRLMLIFSVFGLGFVSHSALASVDDASVSGKVVDSSGKPQMGAVVEVFSATLGASPVRLLTDDKGFYSATGLLPGLYFVKATAAAFLPSLRENVSLRPGSNTLVNLTLNTLIEAFQLAPSRRRTDADQDDWRWTLRSAANRPILRILEDDGPLVVVSRSEANDDRILKAKVAFIAGSDGQGFSGSDMHTAFAVEQSIFSSGTMSLNGSVGYNAGQANGVVRASYRQELSSGSHPEIAFTAHRFATPESASRHAALNAMSLSLTDSFTVAEFLEVNYGGELQSIQYRGRVGTFRPFGSMTAHISPDTLIEYRYATSRPSTRLAKGFDSTPADLTETNPRVSLAGDSLSLERAGHHEIAASHRFGDNSLQLALYTDRMRNTAITGVGDVDSLFDSGEFLPDVYSNTFTYKGGDYRARGFRLVGQRRFTKDFSGTLNYSYGGALALAGSLDPNSDHAAFRTRRVHGVTTKFAGCIPGAKTRWVASYKWTTGSKLVTPVDMFNASAGQADPYFNLFLRQPLPGVSFLPGKVEALVDVRNLLSQGYVPMIATDGRTLYLVQSARAIRGGVSFNF